MCTTKRIKYLGINLPKETNMSAKLENSPEATGLEDQFSFQSQRKAMPKNVQTTAKLHSSHTLAK